MVKRKVSIYSYLIIAFMLFLFCFLRVYRTEVSGYMEANSILLIIYEIGFFFRLIMIGGVCWVIGLKPFFDSLLSSENCIKQALGIVLVKVFEVCIFKILQYILHQYSGSGGELYIYFMINLYIYTSMKMKNSYRNYLFAGLVILDAVYMCMFADYRCFGWDYSFGIFGLISMAAVITDRKKRSSKRIIEALVVSLTIFCCLIFYNRNAWYYDYYRSYFFRRLIEDQFGVILLSFLVLAMIFVFLGFVIRRKDAIIFEWLVLYFGITASLEMMGFKLLFSCKDLLFIIPLLIIWKVYESVCYQL